MFNYYVDQMVGQTSSWLDVIKLMIPVGTLVLGIFINRWFNKVDKRRKDKKTTRDLLTEIELLEEPMKRQLASVDEHIVGLRSDKDEVSHFTLSLHLKMDRLAILDRSGVVDHLERALGNRSKALGRANELFLGCDTITFLYQQLIGPY